MKGAAIKTRLHLESAAGMFTALRRHYQTKRTKMISKPIPLQRAFGATHVSGKRIVGLLADGMPRFLLEGDWDWTLADDPEEPYVDVLVPNRTQPALW